MSGLSVSRHIDAPPAEVFAVASDFARGAETITAILEVEMLTDGPVGVGSRFRETRMMFGKSASEEMEVTLFEPPHRYVLDAESHGSHYRSELRFEEKDGGTEVTMSFEATPLTFFARLMSFLMRPMMKKMLVEACGKDLEDLKAVVEGKGG